MAKTKKDINAFQKAMLSNTKIIGNDDSNKAQSAAKETGKNKLQQDDTYSIPQDLVNKYEVFAKELNIKPSEAIVLALNHFLDLKGFLKDYE